MASVPADDPYDAEAVALWAQYAKERYEAAEKRLSDFRSSGRQLAAAVAVVFGLEAALTGQVIKLLDHSPAGLAVCAALLLGAAAYQLVVMGRAIAAGYIGEEVLAAESPAALADHAAGKDEAWMRRTVGAYYAKGSDNLHRTAEAAASEIGALARHFKRSLWLLFGAAALAAALSGFEPPSRKAMAETPVSIPGSPGEAAPAPAVPSNPAPAAPPANPLLVTPTPGQIETRAAPPPRETLAATPVVAQPRTESSQPRNK